MNIKKYLILVSLSLFTSAVFADDAAIFKSKCGACHALNSVSKGTMGPNLTGFATKRSTDFLKLYMTNPAEGRKKYSEIYEKEIKGKYKSNMPAVKLTDSDIGSILNAMK